MAQHVSELLASLPVMRQAQVLVALQKQFDVVLPLRFRGEAQVVAQEDGELRVLCANGAVASRLRLEAQDLANALQSRGLPVERVVVRVQPSNRRKFGPARTKRMLPAAARQAFQSVCEQLEDGEVKAALKKLLEHHRER